MRFTPSNCKIVLQNWVSVSPSLSAFEETIEIVYKFVYRGSCMTTDVHVADQAHHVSREPKQLLVRCVIYNV